MSAEPAPRPGLKPIRLLIVDDSVSVRTMLTRQFANDPEIEVVGTAKDGIEGVNMVRDLKPDVITLDVEMPRQDGLRTIEEIMRDYPTPVVMVSSLTAAGTATTIRALELGAFDFVQKPVRAGLPAMHEIAVQLTEKIKQASHSNVRRAAARTSHASLRVLPPATRTGFSWLDKVVVIASSTGGPPALKEVLTAFPADFTPPILVVQHMPAGFTKALADRLNTQSAIEVREAQAGDRLKPGLALIAPGGFHMTLARGNNVRLGMGPTECGVRPAANVLMESVADVCGNRTVGVVLTGMGSDGTRGAGLIKAAGGTIVAEDKSTCAVYGMPRSVAEAGYVDVVAPLPKVTNEILRLCRAAESK